MNFVAGYLLQERRGGSEGRGASRLVGGDPHQGPPGRRPRRLALHTDHDPGRADQHYYYHGLGGLGASRGRRAP